MNFIYSVLGTPLGYVMWVLYKLVNSFGIAVILFTFIVKAASFPLNLKQQRNMAASQLFMPRVQELQRKYKNNQPKLQEEMAKLQKEGYNPMGGCAPMFLIMIILFGVIDVVYKPMTHLERFDKEEIAAIKNVAMETDYASIVMANPDDADLVLKFEQDQNIITISESNPQNTLPAGESFTPLTSITSADREKYGTVTANNLQSLAAKTSRLSKEAKDALNNSKSRYGSIYGEINVLQAHTKSPDAFNDSGLSSDTHERLSLLQKNMMFAGIDLGQTPSLALEPLIIIPILSFVFSMLQMLLSQKLQGQQNAQAMQQPGAKAMLYIAPFFSLFISFTVPAGAGLYWGISYLFGIAQSLVMYKFWPNDKLREQARIKNEANKVEVKATIVDVDEKGNEVTKIENLSELSAKEQKEYFRKKLEQARKEDALKYGDVTDDEIEEFERKTNPIVQGIDEENKQDNADEDIQESPEE